MNVCESRQKFAHYLLNVTQFSILATLGFSLVSCAGNYRRPESFEAKMARFQPKNTNPNIVPKLELDPAMPETFRRPSSRGPASKSIDENKLPSNKRLYFITLYGQYRNISEYVDSEKAPDLNHCPSFHSSLISYKEGLPPLTHKRVSITKRYTSITPDSVGKFPELALPVSLDSENPRLYDVIANHKEIDPNQYLTQALKVHLTKTYKELEELCESGSSDNYYNYENLTTHIQRKGNEFHPNKKSLKTLLKTTLFSNMTLIESLNKNVVRKRGPASSNVGPHKFYQEGLIQKLGVEWTHSYFKSVGR
jgi:hypothetical protein